VEEIEWYNLTGNGFPPPLYSVFKIMWYRDYEPEMFDKIDKIIGTKDFINYKLTGQISRLSMRFIRAMRLPNLFLRIMPIMRNSYPFMKRRVDSNLKLAIYWRDSKNLNFAESLNNTATEEDYKMFHNSSSFE
jgi:ribulose kinase